MFSVALTFLGLTCVTFFIGRVIPIDPVLAIVGDKASRETYNRVRIEIGLDQPIPVQFWRYLVKVLHGDFGNSVITSQPVLHDLLRVFPATIELSMLALIIGVVLGIPLGVVAATTPSGMPSTTPMMSASTDSSRVAGKTCNRSCRTGCEVMTELPKSPCSTLTR